MQWTVFINGDEVIFLLFLSWPEIRNQCGRSDYSVINNNMPISLHSALVISFRSFGNIHRFFSCCKKWPLGESRAFIPRLFLFLPWTFYPISKRNHRVKRRSCRSLAIANVASERKRTLIEIIGKSSRLLSVSDCLFSQKKNVLPTTSQ